MARMTREERAERKAAQEASIARQRAHHEETGRVVATGQCPLCGAGVHRNLSAAGWWQCDRLGAMTHRIDRTGPACEWQGFTGSE